MTKVSASPDRTGYTTYSDTGRPRKIKPKEILLWGRGRRKNREGGGPLRDLVTPKEAERSAGAEGGATRAAEGRAGAGRPRDGDRRRALGTSRVKNKLAGLGAVESAGPSEPGASAFGTPAIFGVSLWAFLLPKKPLGFAWMDSLSITAKRMGLFFSPTFSFAEESLWSDT